MPFYDLKCNKCGERFNKRASIEERTSNKITCPKCNSNDLSAVFSNVNIITKTCDSSSECPNIHKCGGCCNH